MIQLLSACLIFNKIKLKRLRKSGAIFFIDFMLYIIYPKQFCTHVCNHFSFSEMIEFG